MSEQTERRIKRMLNAARSMQNALVRENEHVNVRDAATTFSSKESRNLSCSRRISRDQLVPSKLLEINRTEAYRLIKGHQERQAVASCLQAHAWQLPYEACKKLLGNPVDYELYKNLMRSQRLPRLPKVKTVRLPLSSVNYQFSQIAVEGRLIQLELVAFDRRVTLEFEIPAKLYELHANFEKITRPTLRLTPHGELHFDFSFVERSELGEPSSDTPIGFDLGKARVIVGVRGTTELVQSVHTDRDARKLAVIDAEIARLMSKRARRALHDVVHAGADRQLKLLRAKRDRIIEARDWNAATDVIKHARPGEPIALERLTFNTGGSQFRSGSLDAKICHKARRAGKRVVHVNPKGTTGTCPQCGQTGLPFVRRKLTCSCGYTSDRDYSSAIIVAMRGQRSLQRSRETTRKEQGQPRNKKLTLVQRPRTPQPETVAIPRKRTGVSRPPTRIRAKPR
jgi:transposase